MDIELQQEVQTEQTLENQAQPEAEAEQLPQTQPEAGQQPEEVPAEVPKIRVKYNREERDLTLDEARELAEKGLYADKAIGRIRRMEQLARRAGFDSIEAFGQSWESQLDAQQKADFKQKTGIDREDIDPVVRQIVESDPSVLAAREIVRKNQLEEAVRELRGKVPECTYKSAADLLADKDFEKINRLVQAGMTLEESYSAVYAGDIAAARAAAVKKPAPSAGSVTSSQAPKGKTFFTKEQVLAMKPEEVAANLDAIQASQPLWK